MGSGYCRNLHCPQLSMTGFTSNSIYTYHDGKNGNTPIGVSMVVLESSCHWLLCLQFLIRWFINLILFLSLLLIFFNLVTQNISWRGSLNTLFNQFLCLIIRSVIIHSRFQRNNRFMNFSVFCDQVCRQSALFFTILKSIGIVTKVVIDIPRVS